MCLPEQGVVTAPAHMSAMPVMCHHMRFELREATNEAGQIRFVIEKPSGWVKPSGRGPLK
jgi:hypothetical protein